MSLPRQSHATGELVLRLCDDPGLFAATGERIPLSRKAFALLAYLVMEPRAQSRQQVAALLWPESDEIKAATSLRQALTKLRDAMGSRLLTDRFSVAIDHQRPLLRTDVGDFEMLVDSDPVAAVGVDLRAFLTQMPITDAAEYEQWADRTRRRLMRQATDALRAVAQECVARREWMRASEIAAQWQRIDPDSEAAVTLAIEAAYMRRDVEAGRALFEQFDRGRRYGQLPPPSDAMRAQVQRLESLAIAMTPAHGVKAVQGEAPAPIPLTLTSLHERDDSWQVVSAAYLLAEREKGSAAVLLRGTAGVGRSRLLHDAVAWMASRGATVLMASLTQSNVALSYATLGALVRSGIDAPGLGGIDGVYLRELMLLVPELSSRFPGVGHGGPPSGVPGWPMLEALDQALRAMSEDGPVVVAIDDATWCDRESGGLLQSLIERLEKESIVWLATICEDEVAIPASTFPEFFSSRATSILLAPLSVSGVAGMMREASGLDDGWDAFAENVHCVTHGVPALVQAAVSQLLTANHGCWTRVQAARVPVPMPASATLRRIESLSDMEREVLVALSLMVEGLRLTSAEWKETPALTPHLLSHVHGISRLRAARIGDSLVERRLACVSGTGFQCASPVIARFMVTNGSSIMRDELRRRLHAVRRNDGGPR